MTVPELYAAVLEMFGVGNGATPSTAARDRALIDINAGIQQMQLAGEEFYGREEATVSLVTGQAAYDLPKTVQTVLEPVYLALDGTPLRKLDSRGQMQVYAQVFQGSLTPTIANGKPAAYFIEPLRDTHVDDGKEDSVKVRIHVLPQPSVTYNDTNLVLNVVKEPVLLTVADLADPEKRVPVPHKYVESILLPLVRWNATSSYLFTQKDMLDRYQAEYERALNLLGVADPRKDKPEDSNTNALRQRDVASDRRAA